MPVLLQLPDVPAEYADRLDGECEFRQPRKGDLGYTCDGEWFVAGYRWNQHHPCYRLKPEVKYFTPDNAYALQHPQCECEAWDSCDEAWEPGCKLLAVADGCTKPFCVMTTRGNVGWWSKCRVKVRED